MCQRAHASAKPLWSKRIHLGKERGRRARVRRVRVTPVVGLRRWATKLPRESARLPGPLNVMRCAARRTTGAGIRGQRPGHPPVLASAVPNLRPCTETPRPLSSASPRSEELDRVVRVASAAVAGFKSCSTIRCPLLLVPDANSGLVGCLGSSNVEFDRGMFPGDCPSKSPTSPDIQGVCCRTGASSAVRPPTCGRRVHRGSRSPRKGALALVCCEVRLLGVSSASCFCCLEVPPSGQE
jgi:hypothetical protein